MNSINGCPNCQHADVVFKIHSSDNTNTYDWYLCVINDDYYDKEIKYCPFCGVLLLNNGTFQP